MIPIGPGLLPGVLPLVLNVAMLLLAVALGLAFVRLVRGPTLPDRVVALELTATVAVGVIAVYDVVTHQPVFLDVATVMALVAFLGPVAFAHYIEKGAAR